MNRVDPTRDGGNWYGYGGGGRGNPVLFNDPSGYNAGPLGKELGTVFKFIGVVTAVGSDIGALVVAAIAVTPPGLIYVGLAVTVLGVVTAIYKSNAKEQSAECKAIAAKFKAQRDRINKIFKKRFRKCKNQPCPKRCEQEVRTTWSKALEISAQAEKKARKTANCD